MTTIRSTSESSVGRPWAYEPKRITRAGLKQLYDLINESLDLIAPIIIAFRPIRRLKLFGFYAVLTYSSNRLPPAFVRIASRGNEIIKRVGAQLDFTRSPNRLHRIASETQWRDLQARCIASLKLHRSAEVLHQPRIAADVDDGFIPSAADWVR